MDAQTRKRLIDEHLDAIRELEAQATGEIADESQSWPPDGFYMLWHVVVGLMLGGLGALVSLTANVFGAPLFGRRSLELIRVYLTFPMGAKALEVEEGMVLFVGCMLYLVTGALYGVFLHLVMTLYFNEASEQKKLVVATVIGLALWIVNFYLIISWLQPMLLGDNWIVRLIPWWVGALTHLAFAWSVLAAELWGDFGRFRGQTA